MSRPVPGRVPGQLSGERTDETVAETETETEAEAESARGIAKLEGYLLSRTHRQNAHAEAEAFADRLPWLTPAQYEDVVRLYTADRMALTRRVLEATVERCGELRREYTARYEELRSRLLRRVTVMLLASLVASITALVLSLHR